MIDDMGIFRTTIEIAPWTNHAKRMTFAGGRSAPSIAVFAQAADMTLLAAAA